MFSHTHNTHHTCFKHWDFVKVSTCSCQFAEFIIKVIAPQFSPEISLVIIALRLSSEMNKYLYLIEVNK